jgi:formylglycine-generating enzyme required for sulfatase activity
MSVNVASSMRAQTHHQNMVWVEGGTFRMGSDRHYPEEAPVHRVTVDGFLIDRTPVTKRAFRKFVNETGYVTFAEIPPKREDYPGALPHMLKAGSLVFTPPKHPVDLNGSASFTIDQIARDVEAKIKADAAKAGAR